MPTKIQWTTNADGTAGETWNPVGGCRKVSAGCANCYAIRQAHRLAGNPNEKIAKRYAGLTKITNGKPNWTGGTFIDEEVLLAPLHRHKPTTYFISLSDLFYPERPYEDIDNVFAAMAMCPQHTFQVLTKYPSRMLEYLSRDNNCEIWADTQTDLLDETFSGNDRAQVAQRSLRKFGNKVNLGEHPLTGRNLIIYDPPDIAEPLPNVWLGVSCEDQKHADERIPLLLRTSAAVRFVSCEPLLASVDLYRYMPWSDISTPEFNTGLDWVIVGGESGPGARGCDVAWIRSIVQQCKDAGVPVFVKQLGAYAILDPRYNRSFSGWTRKLRDRKGGDMEEWPYDVRVREYPEVAR